MVAGRGARGGTRTTGAVGWRRRQAACRQASEQKRRRPAGWKWWPQIGQAVVTPSLRGGVSGMAALALALLQRPPEAVRLGAGLEDVGAIGDPVEQRLAEPRVRDDLG